MGYTRVREGRPGHPHARGCSASRRPAPRRSCNGAPVAEPADHRHRDPHRQPRVVGPGDGRARRVRRLIEAVTDRADPVRVPAAAGRGGRVRRAGLRRRRGRAAQARPSTAGSSAGSASWCTVTGNGLKDPEWAITGAPRAGRRAGRRRGRRGAQLGWTSETLSSIRYQRTQHDAEPVFRPHRCASGSRPPARTSAPASTPSGLALGLHDEVTVRVADAGLEVEVEGEGARHRPARRAAPGRAGRCARLRPARRASRRAARALRQPDPARPRPRLLLGGDLRRHHRRAGAGRRTASSCSTTTRCSQLATEIEGHPDNVAACLRGGFTIGLDGPADGPDAAGATARAGDRPARTRGRGVHPGQRAVHRAWPAGLLPERCRTPTPRATRAGPRLLVAAV